MTNRKMKLQEKIATKGKLDFNFKFRPYSKSIMGYRFKINEETHYIINSAIQYSEMFNVISILTTLDSSYDDNGFVLLLEDYKIVADDSYTGKHNSDSDLQESNIIDFNLYRSIKSLLRKWDEEKWGILKLLRKKN